MLGYICYWWFFKIFCHQDTFSSSDFVVSEKIIICILRDFPPWFYFRKFFLRYYQVAIVIIFTQVFMWLECIVYFSSYVIIKKVTRVVLFTSRFDLYDLLFVPNYFQSHDPHGKIMSSQSHRCMDGIIFNIISGCAPVLSWFHSIVTESWKHLDHHILGLLLVLCFWSNLKNLCMIFRCWGLLYEMYRIFRQWNQTQLHCPLLLLELFGIYVEENQKILWEFLYSRTIISRLELGKCISSCSTVSFDAINLSVLVNWNFPPLEMLILFNILFRSGLIFWGYCSINKIWLLSFF